VKHVRIKHRPLIFSPILFDITSIIMTNIMCEIKFNLSLLGDSLALAKEFCDKLKVCFEGKLLLSEENILFLSGHFSDVLSALLKFKRSPYKPIVQQLIFQINNPDLLCYIRAFSFGEEIEWLHYTFKTRSEALEYFENFFKSHTTATRQKKYFIDRLNEFAIYASKVCNYKFCNPQNPGKFLHDILGTSNILSFLAITDSSFWRKSIKREEIFGSRDQEHTYEEALPYLAAYNYNIYPYYKTRIEKLILHVNEVSYDKFYDRFVTKPWRRGSE
jgi:hypothetical protein